jgi:hypothetical protein
MRARWTAWIRSRLGRSDGFELSFMGYVIHQKVWGRIVAKADHQLAEAGAAGFVEFECYHRSPACRRPAEDFPAWVNLKVIEPALLAGMVEGDK